MNSVGGRTMFGDTGNRYCSEHLHVFLFVMQTCCRQIIFSTFCVRSLDLNCVKSAAQDEHILLANNIRLILKTSELEKKLG